MINALHAASTGMSAQQTRIDGIANDLANLNTVGYKKTRAEFEDLYYDQVKLPGASNSATTISPNGIQVGHGTKMTSLTKIFSAGDIESTGQQLDLAIEGQGFFKFTDENGNAVYSRNGTLQLNQDGALVNSNGLLMDPSFTIPSTTTSVTIGKDGTISIKTADSADVQELGKIQLSMFQNPAGLEYLGSNLYRETTGSGTATSVDPGNDGAGKLEQGFLESSNVNIGDALISMVVAQRSYESNAKVIETADRMMQSVNNIL